MSINGTKLKSNLKQRDWTLDQYEKEYNQQELLIQGYQTENEKLYDKLKNINKV